MRYGVISDIHANLDALLATLRALAEERIDRLFCCGDIVGYGANPNECCDLMRLASPGRRKPNTAKVTASLRETGLRVSEQLLERVRSWRCRTVAGNHDWAVAAKEGFGNFNAYARAAAQWQATQLRPENAAFLSALPLIYEEKKTILAHGAPYTPGAWPYITSLAHAQRAFRHFKGPLCIIGHSHVPFVAVLDKEKHCRAGALDTITPRSGDRYLVNAGSVGQPRDKNPAASYLLLKLPEGKLSLRRVSYDVAAAQGRMKDAGLPDFLIDRLAKGM